MDIAASGRLDLQREILALPSFSKVALGAIPWLGPRALGWRWSRTAVEADLIDRVPQINKREIRALSLAGALNFDNTVHRREALWQSELAIKQEGDLFEFGMRNAECGIGDESAIRNPKSAFVRLEGLDLVDADLRKTGISIGKHPMIEAEALASIDIA